MSVKKNNRLFEIKGQYLKNLSIDSPNVPMVLFNAGSLPKVDVSVNVSAARIGQGTENADSLYQVLLDIVVKAKITSQEDKKDSDAFNCNTQYGCVVLLDNELESDDETKKRILLITVPQFIFPFARHVIARSVGDCAFPPLMLEVIDFEKIYHDNQQENN